MPTVSNFLIERLENLGVNHIFGIPGDYVLNFYENLWNNKNIKLINNTDENHSGFAADAYSRVNGVGCVCVTYNVGASKIINAVQCAYAERSPLIVICGSPGMNERKDGALLHHMVGSFNSQKDMFDHITCASVVLDDPTTAGFAIDSAIEAMKHHKQPIYIELPRDVAKKSISYDVYNLGTPKAPESDSQNLEEAIEEVVEWVKKSKNPVILAGVEVSRYNLGEKLQKFAEKTNIPIATTLLSKSVVNENQNLFAGIYAGESSHEETKKLVEDSDCLLMFGVMLTDMTLSFMPAKFHKRQVVSCGVKGLKVKNHTYEDVQFFDFCESLFGADIPKKETIFNRDLIDKGKFTPQAETKITTKRLFEKIDSILNKDMAIIADIGDSLFGASDLTVHYKNHFISPAFYTSMGAAIPGALGVQLAKPNIRPIVIVGDGALQMSITELSTIFHLGLTPIIFVLNNGGYTTERFLREGDFNDILNWQYHKFTEVIGGGVGKKIETEEELEIFTTEALDSKELYILNVCVESHDVSPALERITKALKQRI